MVEILQNFVAFSDYMNFTQDMSCEGACAHAHVQCAVVRVRVRAKSILKSVRDVRACGSFLGVRCATVFLHIFGTKLPENTILEHLFLLYNVLSCFRTSYFVLEHPKMLKNCLKFAENILKNC